MEKTWKTINETLNRNKKNSNVASILYHNGNVLSNAKDIANAFNVYFANIGKNLASEVQLGPRYEGHLNPMAEPISHEVCPLVRTHVYHPYHAADRQAETDS